MLGLELRDEFTKKRLTGTAIDLAKAQERSASDFLEITYPTLDLLKLLEASAPDRGMPIVLKGERGQGKSHLLATLFHVLTDGPAAKQWLKHWGGILNSPKVAGLALRKGLHIISDSLHRQQNKYLWDLLFDKHPHGGYCRGKWDALGDKKTDIPSEQLLIEMFKHTPTALILDEFQTWFDGLSDSKQQPQKNRAFNFIQLLSEIAKNHPDLLLLVVSVRNSNTDAFQQIQRVAPVVIDFKGPDAKRDRLRLLLHRLFKNRLQVTKGDIEAAVQHHFAESVRLLNVPAADQDKLKAAMIEAWPFAPSLIQLLEDQVLVATSAQETRDLIRILVDLFKHGDKSSPVITAAEFRLDDEASGVVALIDSLSNLHHQKLREKALRNLEEVKNVVSDHALRLPHLDSIMGALWLRSLADVNQAGADSATLHVDITRAKVVDDNQFDAELQTIAENSFSIHRIGDRFIFKEEDNPQAKLMASARNDKLFNVGEYEGLDDAHLAKEVRWVLGSGQDTAQRFHVVVLPEHWRKNPWEKVPDNDNPSRWDERIQLIVLPEPPPNVHSQLGEWLKDNLQKNRNGVRFVIPKAGTTNIYADKELKVLARCVVLCDLWKGTYEKLKSGYQQKLRDILKARFDQFAIINNWNYQDPKNCQFTVMGHGAQGGKVPQAIDDRIRADLFDFDEFQNLVIKRAQANGSIGKLLAELREPAPNGKDSLPWIGETPLKAQIAQTCADGKIAIDLRGMEILQLKPGENAETCKKRVEGKLSTGRFLDETLLQLPSNVPGSSTVTKPQPGPGPQPPTTPGFPPPGVGTPPPGGTTSTTPPPGGSIFTGPATLTHLHADATSALNLLGRLESWNVNEGTQLQNMRIRVGKMTGAQLRQLMRNLPDGLHYDLELDREDT